MIDKLNLIAIVQQLPEEDIKTIENYIKALEEENEKLKQAERNTYETSQEMLSELTKQNEFLRKRENKLQVLEMKNKEFIKWLELNWKETQDIWFVKIINKHKEIMEKKEE